MDKQMTRATEALHQIGLIVVRMMILRLWIAAPFAWAARSRPAILLHQGSFADSMLESFLHRHLVVVWSMFAHVGGMTAAAIALIQPIAWRSAFAQFHVYVTWNIFSALSIEVPA